MNKNPPKLESSDCPLSGVCMIEAAAGTGKTYNIQNLFLRFIIEHALPVQSILVMTFTEAATAELKDRIRRILHDADAFLENPEAIPDEERSRLERIVGRVRETVPEPEIRKRLRDALLDFDAAMIATIHGFCQRMLSEYAFESGVLFNTEIKTDQDSLVRAVLTDFVRTEFYPEDPDGLRSELRKSIRFTAESAFPLVRGIIARSDLHLKTILPEKYSLDGYRARIAESIGKLRALYRPGVLTKLCAALNKEYAPEVREEMEKVLGNWTRTGMLYGVLEVLLACSPEKISRYANKKKKENVMLLAEELRNPFFQETGNLESRLTLYKTALPLTAAEFVKCKLEEQKARENFQTFDDLLTRVRDSVLRPDSRLAPAIRKKFAVAVIDEFQDTDPVQYETFHALFAEREEPALFLVGDPRQAIYAFRGGDIATYRRAVRECEAAGGVPYQLTDNYRSSAPMIEAVNEIFRKHPFPFADPEIEYPEVFAPILEDGQKRRGLLENGVEISRPLKFSFLESDAPLSVSALRERALRACAADILHLLQSPQIQRPDGDSVRPLRPNDFAVLVFNGYEGERMKAELSRLRIPSVIPRTGNVFDSVAAAELERVLPAVAAPSDGRAAANAMQSVLLGYSTEDLIRIHADTSASLPLDGVQEKLSLLSNQWRHGSFIEMFHEMLLVFRVRERLLRLPDGERILTDLLHLRELLHKESSANSLSMTGLLHYLAKQRCPDTRSEQSEEMETLLETDRAAVTILTIHKSKGLEFPVVMLPALYSMNMEKHAENYHREDGALERDLTGDPRCAALAQAERLQELLRLVYVAFTRAKYACYVYWGDCKTKNTALDWLFSLRHLNELPSMDGIRSAFGTVTGTPLAAIPPFQRIPETAADGVYVPSRESIPLLPFRGWTGRPDPDWRFTSYSGMTPQGYAQDLPCDFDAEDEEGEPESAEGIFGIPGGRNTGNAWHELLETVDFHNLENPDLRSTAQKKLESFGLPKDGPTLDLTCGMVRNLLSAPLHPPRETVPFTLSSISREDRLSELEFCYRFKAPFRTSSVRNLLGEHLERIFGESGGNGEWDLHFSGGYLTGFIDLLFRHNGKIYLADWKSNKLKGRLSHFQPEGLKREMMKHFYPLQYMIYSVAVFKYLRLRNGSFTKEDYERLFGGVFYFFLRGISPEAPGRGIFFDRPPYELVLELEKILG